MGEAGNEQETCDKHSESHGRLLSVAAETSPLLAAGTLRT